MRPYQDTELRLHGGLDTSLVRALQRDLRALGYLGGGIDGVFGGGTEKAVRSLQWDLLNHVRDTDAPLAIKDYAGGRVTTVTGVVDSGLAACIDDMTGDANFVKVPSSSTPAEENQRAADAIRAMGRMDVPKPFLLAILGQESNWRHFAVPAGSDEDNFVTLGLDRNGKHGPDQITSRGYGIGQYTFDYHPLPQDKMRGDRAWLGIARACPGAARWPDCLGRCTPRAQRCGGWLASAHRSVRERTAPGGTSARSAPGELFHSRSPPRRGSRRTMPRRPAGA